MTDIPLRVPHSIYSFFWCEGQPPGSGACFVWALPLGCIPAWVHDVYLGEAHTEPESLKESESVWSTEKGKRRGRRDPSRIGDRGRAGGGCRRGGQGELSWPPSLRPRGQSGRQEAGGPGRQWRGGVRNLGLNLALPLQGSGPPVHLHAKERRNEYAARAVIGPPRPPPPPPHYNFPNRILQSGPYSLAHKQFCFSALEPVNHAEREHLGRRRGPSRALLRVPPRAPPSGFVPGSSWVLGWRGKGACCRVLCQHAFGKAIESASGPQPCTRANTASPSKPQFTPISQLD